MSGYIHDPLQIINLIADNLRDRYKSGFPVLKEIIQNADDAGSGDEEIQLEFGLSHGIPKAEHPLLKGAALYFLNNGAFTQADHKAIRSFGLNRKAIEEFSIGKFGLGMKSVFHFCEAFFFLAKCNEKPYKEILNPWSGGDDFPSVHDDWNNFSVSDANLIFKHVRPVVGQMDLSRGTIFLLWLPLRKKKHLLVNGKEAGSIISEFPGDNLGLLSFLSHPSLAQRIASLLPLLHRITSIRFWHFNDSGMVAAPQFQVSLKGAVRIGLADGQYRSKAIAGTVTYHHKGNEDASYSLTYSGREKIIGIPGLISLRQSPLWPKSYVRDDLGRTREAPDKARGHGAVVFSRSNEKGQGRLKIRWAVFLPVDAAREEVTCGGESCFRITLHGYFFIDAGRVDIDGLQEGSEFFEDSAQPQNEVELRRLWNIRLARRGTLPLVLPSLEAFVVKARLSADDTWHLSNGILGSKLFHRHRQSICVESLWACCLTLNGRQWRLLPRDASTLPLPAPPLSAPERPWETFPGLKSFQDRGTELLLKDAPHLLAHPLPQWKEADLLEVLHIKENELFADQGCIDYLLQFMADSAVRPMLNAGSLQERLSQVANRAFIVIGTGMRQYRKKVQEFVSFIQPKRRYPLKPDAPQVIRELQQCTTGVLILANEFDSTDSPGTANLFLEDAYSLLQKLHDLVTLYEHGDEQESVKHCRALAKGILQGQNEEHRRELLIRAERLKILEGYDCVQEKLVALSPADLRGCRESRLLYLYSQGVNDLQRRGLASKLQRAINETVFLIASDTAKLVFGTTNDLAPCNADNALDSLGTKIISLQTVGSRRQLLQDVAGANLESQQKVRGLRYLLHGLEDYFGDERTLWVSGYDQSPVWGKIWRQLENHHEDGWNILDRELVEEIPANKWPKLSIREIKSSGILAELRDNGIEKITGDQFSVDERNAVLKELSSDEKLWRELPFHETVKGELVPITTGKSYLETGIALPDELYRSADIIKRSKDPVIKRQQREWIIPLSKEGVIRIALRHDEPMNFWRLLMDNLESASDFIKDPLIRETSWLPDVSLTPVKPTDVLYLEKIQDEVDRLLAVARGAFWSPGKMHADLRTHPSFEFLQKNCFATDRTGFENLALLLGETNEYHVGRVVCPVDGFERLVQTCARLPFHLRLPGWILLARAISAYPADMVRDLLLPETVKPISAERIVAVLNWLQEEHVKVGKAAMKDILAAFNAYLSGLVNEKPGIGYISRLLMLNCDGDWKPAKELCSEAEGVADSHLLDFEQTRILQNVIFHADRQQAIEDDRLPKRRNLEPEISAAADQLEAFFAEWEGLVAPEIICAFLSLLGDDPKMLALAGRYRGRHSVEWVRDSIPWQVHHRRDELHRQEWMYGLDQHQALAQHRFIVRFTDGDMVKTVSILGYEIDVPLKSRFTSLITGGLFYEYPDKGINIVRITLRNPIDKDVSPSELSGLLRSAAEYLLNKAYNQKDCDLGSLWEELDRSEQLDIRIAQQLVLNHIPFYLRQLGVQQHPHLKELLGQWSEARYKREEYYESKEKREAFEKDERALLGQVQRLLKTDDHVQHVVLDAVRAKMKDFQYSTSSIPFELFQNADDAVVELAMMRSYPNPPEEVEDSMLPEHVRRFLVIECNDSVTFAHWGRPVNAVGSAGFPGHKKGFHQDLEKMLVLSSSDKSEDGRVTGKFGLGFKSVLLACDRPRLMSGRLATEIIAGLCPTQLEDSARLRRQLNELSADRRWQGTLLELPLTDITPTKIMEPFSQLAGIMTIFSRKIRRIEIRGDTDQAFEWKPEQIALSADACIEFGELPLPVGQNIGGLSVYFRLLSGGVIFSLGPVGFRSLPAELPDIWVVTPTRESEGSGFAVNCMFDVDAGRARLAGNSSVNKKKAQALGREFGQALRQLSGLVRERWDRLKADLRFERDLSVYDFWETLWKVIAEGLQTRKSSEVSSIFSELICGGGGIGYLVAHEDAMPNGLWGSYQSLTRPEKIRFVLKGCLSDEAIFRELAEWDYFRDFLGDPEETVSEAVYSFAHKVSPAIGQSKDQWRSLRLADVLRQHSDDVRKITPETAAALGKIINRSALNVAEFAKEKELIEKALHSFWFKTRDETFRAADEIIVASKHANANPDEAKRASFAQNKNILSKDYLGSGLDFFFSCREKISIPVEKMVQWLLDASTDEQRGHGLRYLLDGEHGERVASLLRARGLGGTWLAELEPDSPCFSGWSKDDKLEILFRKLPSIEELHRLHTEAEETPYDLPEEELRGINPKEILQKIHSWWMNTKHEHLAEYERRTYPGNVRLDLGEDDLGRIDRQSWLILFCLAHFHTIGRQRDLQHKGFIEKCILKGWWDVFSAEKPEERSDDWMRVLEEYIGEQVDSSEYEIWMNRFPAIYKFSRWLEDYKEAFFSIEREKSISGISGILKTRVNASFQGGGISAPPIEKSLGIGACFALRELKRKGIINGSQAVPYCYLPTKRTREFIGKIGCVEISESEGIGNSKIIHRFLCHNLGETHADFANCYDIPFQVVAEKEEVLRMILN
ncbi:hypothetical protein Dvar_51010 [Desulfosarcina variabilis str. Montpellier]|uniref:sacsin N-terminal ATP-binding-like domain-containing protein n=1 Tax=Desulfosarcina variabilis TaxID=2300 RepID=UPI003AFAD74F